MPTLRSRWRPRVSFVQERTLGSGRPRMGDPCSLAPEPQLIPVENCILRQRSCIWHRCLHNHSGWNPSSFWGINGYGSALGSLGSLECVPEPGAEFLKQPFIQQRQWARDCLNELLSVPWVPLFFEKVFWDFYIPLNPSTLLGSSKTGGNVAKCCWLFSLYQRSAFIWERLPVLISNVIF